MKKIILLLTLTISFVACTKTPKVNYTLFSGKIEIPIGKTIEINGRGFNQIIYIDEDGSFADTLHIETGYYSYSHGQKNASIFLSPGDNLHLTVNTNEFDKSITYTGIGSENNNYLASKYLLRKKFIEEQKKSKGLANLYALKENEFLEELNKLRDFSNKFLSNSNDLYKDFRSLEKKSIKYKYLENLVDYPDNHRYHAKKNNVVVSENFMNPLKALDCTNEQDYKNFAAYRFLVINHYSQAINDSENVSKVFEELKSIDASTIIEDLIRKIYRNVRPGNENNDALYNGLMTLSSDDEFKEKLTYKYKQLKVLKKGMPSPVFENYENHKGGTTSLEDLKGKYIYIDIWATWCPPCIKEFPYLKELESKYHGKNIEFVSISIDRGVDYDKWFKMVNDKELEGIQLFVDRNYKGGSVRNIKEKFFLDYAIEGVPRFILIDPNGNIVNPEVFYPSDSRLIKLFNELKI